VYLTKRQSQLLDYLRKTIALQGYAPSLEEIASHFQLSSVGTVHKHLKALEEKGAIRRQWNRSRAIEVVQLPDGKARRIPLLGRLAVGQPIEAITESESIAVPEDMLGRAPAFVLKVRGDEVRREGICDGDFLVLEQRDDARDGETVVALIDDRRTTLRRWFKEGDAVRLTGEDGVADGVPFEARRVRVHGVLLGVLRHCR
jgi:repressor LexA